MLSRTSQRVSVSGSLFCQKVLKRTHHCEPASPLFDLRRRRDRSNWCTFDRETIDSMSYDGINFHGMSLDLNFALAFDYVTPHHLAFRNLYPRGLAMYFEGTKDKNHALHTTIHSKPLSTFLKLPTPEEIEAEIKTHQKRDMDLMAAEDEYHINHNGVTQELIDEYRKEAQLNEENIKEWNKLYRPQEEESRVLPDWLALPKNAAGVNPQVASFPRDLRIHLSSFQERLFVHDGVLGSDPRSEFRVRLVTNSPNMALTFSNLVHKTSLQVSARDFKPQLIIFHSADFVDEHSASNYGVEEEKEICYFDWLKGGLFLGGRTVEDAEVLRELLAKASFHYFPNRAIYSLPGFVYSTSLTAPPTLILHHPESSTLSNFFKEQEDKNVYASKYASWSEHGLSSLFADFHTQSPQRGDIVQHIVKNNKEERVNHVSQRKAVPTVVPHPKKIVLVSTSKNSSGSSSSSAELVSEHLNQNFSSFPVNLTKWADAINQRIEKHQVKVERVVLKSDSIADLKGSTLGSLLA